MRGDVYWNVHRKCWSFRDLKTRRVVIHAATLALVDCTLHVSEAGRQRVLRERRKNVHAVIRGTLVDALQEAPGTPITYNPYRNETFVSRVDGAAVREAAWVRFGADRTCTAGLVDTSATSG